jgi:hypothetical protein
MMSAKRETPFDSIESAHEYVSMLVEALEDAKRSIKDDVESATRIGGLERRIQALGVVEYKLSKLREHLQASRRILNDLRTLRRLLLGEREEAISDQPG